MDAAHREWCSDVLFFHSIEKPQSAFNLKQLLAHKTETQRSQLAVYQEKLMKLSNELNDNYDMVNRLLNADDDCEDYGFYSIGR